MFRSCLLKSAAATISTPPRTKCPAPLFSSSTAVTTTTSLRRRSLSSNSSNSSSGNSSSSASSSSGSTSNSVSNNIASKKTFQNEEELMTFLHQANSTMEQYHNTRELMKRGKLPRHASHPANQPGYSGPAAAGGGSSSAIQMAVGVGVFLLAFMSTPFLGKRIAQDAEFRQKYIPAWYDYSVKEPEDAWTAEEFHEQGRIVEQALRRRAAAAAAAAASTDKEAELELTDEQKLRAMWDRVHPGLADGESLHEED
jgi:hypothetical protein